MVGLGGMSLPGVFVVARRPVRANTPRSVSGRSTLGGIHLLCSQEKEQGNNKTEHIITFSYNIDYESSNKQLHYLPPPEAPFDMASRNWLTVSPPLAWLGGYSWNVCRNPPAI